MTELTDREIVQMIGQLMNGIGDDRFVKLAARAHDQRRLGLTTKAHDNSPTPPPARTASNVIPFPRN